MQSYIGKRAGTTGAGPAVVQEQVAQNEKPPHSTVLQLTTEREETAAGAPLAESVVKYIPPQYHPQLVSLVGNRCVVDCVMDNCPVTALWDTGAQSSVVNEPWRLNHLPHTVVRPITDLLEDETLTVLAANNTPIPYIGWIEVSFRLESDPDTISDLQVPILVSSDPAVASDPIIGYNVIETIINRNKGKTKGGKRQLAQKVSKAFAITVETARQVVQLMQNGEPETGVVRTSGKKVFLPANQVTTVYIRAHVSSQAQGQQMFFSSDVLNPLPEGLTCNNGLVQIPNKRTPYIPISVANTSDRNICLDRHSVIGYLEPVKAVYMAPVQTEGDKTTAEIKNSAEIKSSRIGGTPPLNSQQARRPTSWDPPVELGHLSKEQQEAVRRMLQEECEAFAYDSEDVGCIPSLKMHITLHDTSPVQKTYMSVPKPLHSEVKEYLQDLLRRGWITHSRSPYSSPVVCVRKKDGTLRLCVDFRELNRKSVPDRHPIPRIQDMLDALGGSSWFSVLDQGKAYHQGYLDEESRPLTAFITPWGLFEWVRIPFGLSSAPAEFQRSMEHCLADLRDTICLPYLDDNLVHSHSFEEHLEHIRLVLQCYKKHGIKLTPKKCDLFKSSVRFLGKLVTGEGYTMDPAEIAPVVSLKEKNPTTVGEVRQMLGFLSYYRSFIPNFSRVAHPLYSLLTVPNTENHTPKLTMKKPSRTQKKNKGHLPSQTPIQWTSSHQDVLNQLVEMLIQPPVLGYPEFTEPFVLHCDASQVGLGAVLYQRQQGKMRVIAYGSRTLSPAEKRYHLHSGKLEFLALKWAICERFRDYLYHAPSFVVYTDNNPLTYVLTSAKLNATGD